MMERGVTVLKLPFSRSGMSFFHLSLRERSTHEVRRERVYGLTG
jgi:hypothetical protein